jgi:hypothetical protein
MPMRILRCLLVAGLITSETAEAKLDGRWIPEPRVTQEATAPSAPVVTVVGVVVVATMLMLGFMTGQLPLLFLPVNQP